jgi:hypothetical protein
MHAAIEEQLMTSHSKNSQRQEASAVDLVRTAIGPLFDGKPDLLNRILAVVEVGAESRIDEGKGPIRMQITPTIQRNYEGRGVFLQYRPERAAEMLPPLTSVFFVTLEEAEEVLHDAQQQRRKNDGPRGQAKAFGALIDALEASIKNEKFRGCIEFPGEEKVAAARRAASAVFEVGDRVAVWYDNGSKGKPVTIVSPYGLYFANDEDGPYIRNGKKTIYCHGYRAKTDDDQTFFYFARQLAPIGESYGHLRLVK